MSLKMRIENENMRRGTFIPICEIWRNKGYVWQKSSFAKIL